MTFDKGETNLDSELLHQLDQSESAAEPEPVEAVFTVNADSKAAPPPEEVERTVKELVERAEDESGAPALDLNIFRYVSAFAVRGHPELIRALGEQPEVSRGVANQRPDDAAAAGSDLSSHPTESTLRSPSKANRKRRSKGSGDERSGASPRPSRS